jgi:hypothetical protein
MTLTRCFDAAYPPSYVPAGAGAVLGYIGADGLDEDRHIWTPEEWLPFRGLGQFPVWECNTARGAAESAEDAVLAMHALGWHDGRALVASMETTVAPRWWDAFEAEVMNLRMNPVCYGSASTVFGNNALHYWIADWDGIPALPAAQHRILAKQYLSGGGMDWSVVSPELMHHAGRGPRTQPAPSSVSADDPS